MNSLELRIPPLALALLFAFAMALLAWLLPGVAMARPGWALAAVAALPALAGAGFALAGVMAFRRAHTTVNPMTPGSSSSVVTTGVYRWSRNPMYVGFLLVLAGWAIFLGHPVAALLLPLFVTTMNRVQIVPEERVLQAKFGPAYADYRRRVRRWL